MKTIARASTARMSAAASWLALSSACGPSPLLSTDLGTGLLDAGNGNGEDGDPGRDRGRDAGMDSARVGDDEMTQEDSYRLPPGPGHGGADTGASSDSHGEPADGGLGPGYDTLTSCGYTRVDPHHCGTCGHDCMGGACEGGACVPLPPGVLASGLIAPVSIAVDATNVYWLSQGLYSSAGTIVGNVALMKCAKTGCDNRPTVLATGNWDDTSAQDRLEGIVSDGANVYWAGANAIFGCSVNGCNNHPALIASLPGGPPPWVISASATRVFGASLSAVFSCPTTGCTYVNDADGSDDAGGPDVLWPGNAQGVATDPTTAFWNSSGAILSCAIDGCNGSPNLLTSPPTTGQAVGQLAVDQANVYWNLGVPTSFGPPDPSRGPGYPAVLPPSTGGQILKCAKDGCNGRGSAIASGLTAPIGLATDGTSVYFTDVGYDFSGITNRVGRVGKCDVAGCSGSGATLADHLENPRGIAVDADRVYWADFGSGIVDADSSRPLSVDGRIVVTGK
jgi:hypothetical protein